MVVLEQQDKLTLREKLNYMTSRAVQMPLGITLVLFAFQVSDFYFFITFQLLFSFSITFQLIFLIGDLELGQILQTRRQVEGSIEDIVQSF